MPEPSAQAPLHVGIVAGESSGDQLGGALITALRAQHANLRVTAMAGPQMLAAGCDPIAHIDELSVMGLVEVLRQYPRLRRLRRRLVESFIATPPDIFVGIDVPDFALGIASRLRKVGVKTTHYVAPQIWAWRPGRAKKLPRAIDCLFALFPFEQEFFERYGMTTKFVGHPLADSFPFDSDKATLRRELGIEPAGPLIALMPGSRTMELDRHLALFLSAAERIQGTLASSVFALGVTNQDKADRAAAALANYPHLKCQLVVGDSHRLLRAADAAVVVSGTVTMECLFAKTPMVVAYKMAPVSYTIMKRLVKSDYIAMPNILADNRLVPEFIQDAASPEVLAAAVLDWFGDDSRLSDYTGTCHRIHGDLRRDAATQTARHIIALARGETAL